MRQQHLRCVWLAVFDLTRPATARCRLGLIGCPTLREPGPQAAFASPPPPASAETVDSSVSPKPCSGAASAGEGRRNFGLNACRGEMRRCARET
jgi:hypothetical protein